MHHLQFLDPSHDRTLALVGTYHPALVTVSVLMAALAAYAALRLAGRITAAETGRAKGLWLAAGATAMGVGIWASCSMSAPERRSALPSFCLPGC